MDTLIFRVLAACCGLYLVDLLIIGFAFGFGAFLACCAAFWLILRAYHRLMISRSIRPVQSWRWDRFGAACYRMEVA